MKKILILLIPFFLTGCASVNYNLEIEKNLEVSEEVFITGTTDYFNNFYKNYPLTIVEEWYQSERILNTLNENNYNHKIITDEVTYPGVLVKKKYNSLTEYSNNTIFKDQTFEKIYSITNDNLITIKAVDFLPYLEDETDARYAISNLSINIKVPYVVVNHNADKYNKQTNTYTWAITEKTDEKEIELTFDKNKVYVYNLVMYISMFILCLVIVAIIFVVRKYIKKSKINNQIRD